MSLTASQILKTHAQKSKEKKKMKPSLTTINLHKGKNSSGFYGTLLNSHILGTRGQNHVLSSANRQYQNQTNKRFRTRSLNKKDTNTINPQMIKSQIYSAKKGQYEEAFHSVFKGKTQRVIQIEQLLKEQIKQKAYLQKRISQLKVMKIDEDKKRIKIGLNCNKMSNQTEKLQLNTNKVAEQNFNLSIKIKQVSQQCIELKEQIDALQRRNDWTKNRVQEQKKMIKDIKQYNINTQVKIRDQNKKFNFCKQTQTKSLKNMQNSYMYQNQLKQEKALLLVSIQTNFNKNK